MEGDAPRHVSNTRGAVNRASNFSCYGFNVTSVGTCKTKASDLIATLNNGRAAYGSSPGLTKIELHTVVIV